MYAKFYAVLVENMFSPDFVLFRGHFWPYAEHFCNFFLWFLGKLILAQTLVVNIDLLCFLLFPIPSPILLSSYCTLLILLLLSHTTPSVSFYSFCLLLLPLSCLLQLLSSFSPYCILFPSFFSYTLCHLIPPLFSYSPCLLLPPLVHMTPYSSS